MPVKETRPSPARPIVRRIFRRRVLFVLGAAAVVLVVALHYLLLPWVVRGQVRALLDDAGLPRATFRVTRATLWTIDVRDLVLDDVNRVDRIRVRYNVIDLWNAQVNEIVVTGATLAADPGAWPVEKKAGPTTATTAASQPKRAPLELPFARLRVEESQLVLGDGEKVEIEGSLTPTGRSLAFRLRGAGAVDAAGTIAATLDAGNVQVDVQDLPGSVLSSVIGTYVEDAPVSVLGDLSGTAKAAGSPEAGLTASAALRIAGGSLENASGAKLTVASGVFVGEASLGGGGGGNGRGGPATRPAASVKLDGVDLATPDLKAYGVSGAITLVDLSPPATAPRQKLAAERLVIGSTEFANGQLEFEVNESGDIFVRQTRWDFLGGQVYAQDVKVPRDGPLSFTLRAEGVELDDLLATYAKDKVAGAGELYGELPVVIDKGDIRFGEGRLTSLAGGELRITDPETVAQVAEVAGSGAAAASSAAGGSAEQVKRDIAEALQDFVYDRLTARLTTGPDGGLSAYVDIQGHGRTGAKQALRYEPRIHGLDQLLRLYLDVSGTSSTTTTKQAATKRRRRERWTEP